MGELANSNFGGRMTNFEKWYQMVMPEQPNLFSKNVKDA